MPIRKLGRNVFDEALDRLVVLYEEGHRLVVSFSGGKDSCVCLELALIAAELTRSGPVDVVMRDDEIMYPGTFEYAERVAARPEVRFRWLVARQPVVNVFNRAAPYFWAFDPELPEDRWVRRYPDHAEHIAELNIERMATLERFPAASGRLMVQVIGLRAQESRRRKMSMHSSGGYLTKPDRGVCKARPIYDWTDADVWKAIGDHGWDYNHAYDVMLHMGAKRNQLRIGPPTINVHAVSELGNAAKAWPQWFDRVAQRLPGVRTAAMFGRRAVEPTRRLGETWEATFRRECLEEAPDWIAERAQVALRKALSGHAHHASYPLPDQATCRSCTAGIGSWRELALNLYTGDPFCLKLAGVLPYVEPEAFRPGAGRWNGTPSFV